MLPRKDGNRETVRFIPVKQLNRESEHSDDEEEYTYCRVTDISGSVNVTTFVLKCVKSICSQLLAHVHE